MVCQILNHHLSSTKLPYHVKHEVQSNIMDVEEANKIEGFKSTNIVNMQLKEVKIFNSIIPEQMAEFQKKDPQLSLVYDKVLSKAKPKLSEIHCIRSKPTCRLLLQYDRLSLIWGVLHHRTFRDDDETQQLILPHHLHEQTLKSLHDDNGHQGLQRVLDILWEKVYWPFMYADTDHWISQCERCLISKGDYTEPKTQQGSLTAQQPLELLCIDFTKADIAKGGKENILVLTDAFSK